MSKLLNFLTLVGLIAFGYWMIKRYFHQRKLRQEGIVIEQKGLRPITVFSIVLLSIYALYLIVHFWNMS
ncbi:hypothetical protein [Hydrogenovibrio sp. JE_KL2]|jgi:hypothetical protein|uniref:hypothetical protein n=1 Tax=Hydrogenovibrio sp. JE_KL2 TaxID=2651188 RepID=UPI00128AE35B|nr:hypothetical protein [Hydrogenovibrio sp. JE_KL2]MPQ75807.1 hypothetical protein [Hydrogenovibrio sp. JE_KL2]